MSTLNSALEIYTDFPGGNIVVESIDGDTIKLHQDLRDTPSWFYWYFGIRNAAGREIHFHFTLEIPAIGVRGPAVSFDSGKTWQWIGADHVEGNSFWYDFPENVEEVRFSFGMPYQEANWKNFIENHSAISNLETGVLCKTRKGRNVEYMIIKSRKETLVKTLLTCRNHACEMMASYVLEGILDAVFSGGNEHINYLVDHVEIMVVPFVDKDGVEDGDQGKNRAPHDHNRDYGGESIYASVKTMREMVPEWSQGQLKACLDLHCPHIKGTHNEEVYLVGSENETIWKEQQIFADILKSVPDKQLPYKKSSNIPFGEGWNKAENFSQGKSCSRWAGEIPEVKLSTSFEIPYANALDTEVNQVTAKSFGNNIAEALARYLIKD